MWVVGLGVWWMFMVCRCCVVCWISVSMVKSGSVGVAMWMFMLVVGWLCLGSGG